MNDQLAGKTQCLDSVRNSGVASATFSGVMGDTIASDCSLKNREWLTTEQAADYLGLSVGALRNMTSNGQVPYHKLGRRNRYLLVELRQLLFSQKRGASHGN